MKMCDCYEQRMRSFVVCGSEYELYGVCLGTKECDMCSCGGDESRCDFYPEKRKKAIKTMNTAEMWIKAQEDGKTYECVNGNIAYSKENGLFDKITFDGWPLNAWDCYGACGLDKLLGDCEWCEWEEIPSNIMTKAEAEEKFRIKIVD